MCIIDEMLPNKCHDIVDYRCDDRVVDSTEKLNHYEIMGFAAYETGKTRLMLVFTK